MIPFKTTSKQIMRLSLIVEEMKKSGLDQKFVSEAHSLASFDQGAYDLMALWHRYVCDDEVRNAIENDIKRTLSEYNDGPQRNP